MLINAAREPEITDLAHCLVAMGARDRRHRHRPPDDPRRRQPARRAPSRSIPDRIETGTYMMAAAATGGEVRLIGGRLDHVEAVRRIARRAPGSASAMPATGIAVRRRNGRLDRRRRDDRALSGLPDRPAGADHGADGDRRGRLDDHRDDLREPLHARAGAGADGRQHQRASAPRRWCAACRG